MRRTVLSLTLFCTGLPAPAVDFKLDIAPLLKKHCYECHSVETGKKKNGYVFDDLETLAGDIRPSGMIVPGEPGGSPLMELLTLPDGDKRRMPPKGGGLSEKELRLVADWIKEGASLDKKAVLKPSGLAPKKAPDKGPAAAPESWTSVDGRTITAIFIALEGEIVVLKMNGKPYRVALDKLSEASRKQAVERKP